MIQRIIGFILLLITIYLLLIFVAPDFTDKYGNITINRKVRQIKDSSLTFASGSSDPKSLLQNLKNSIDPVINDTKKTIDTVNTTVEDKINAVKEAGTAIENAYNSVQDASEKIKNIGRFESGSKNQ